MLPTHHYCIGQVFNSLLYVTCKTVYIKADMNTDIPLEMAAIFFLANLYLKHSQGIRSEYVMINFICTGLLHLLGAQTENYKMKNSWPQWDSNMVHKTLHGIKTFEILYILSIFSFQAIVSFAETKCCVKCIRFKISRHWCNVWHLGSLLILVHDIHCICIA